MNWEKLESIGQLDEIDQLSESNPIVIFKHSTRCSISSMSLGRLERGWDESKHPSVKPFYLDLIEHRDISNEIASRYGVEHQSPQVLVIENGKCVYHDSHMAISYSEILKQILPLSI